MPEPTHDPATPDGLTDAPGPRTPREAAPSIAQDDQPGTVQTVWSSILATAHRRLGRGR
ncbi:hypothetical protein AB0912_16385 [Streptomyces sp. NPDC007084]|uniref:hypothetical protein n=1 Tax=Streptomyces sp. NPDC007084 TaxID=3154313 RepID=UPI0034556B10